LTLRLSLSTDKQQENLFNQTTDVYITLTKVAVQIKTYLPSITGQGLQDKKEARKPYLKSILQFMRTKGKH